MEVWDYLGEFDFISLCETWLEEKQWGNIKDKLPSEFSWECIFAKRQKKKGRAKGGFLIGIKKDWLGKGNIEITEISEQIVRSTLNAKGETYNIYSIYNTGKLKENLKFFENLQIEEERKLIIGGDFNIRIGELGKIKSFIEDLDCRCSKDKICSNEGKYLVELVENNGWNFLNGTTRGDLKKRKVKKTYLSWKNGKSIRENFITEKKRIEEPMQYERKGV